MTNHSSSNPPPVSLRAKARILKTLGEELISSETVAIIELVKNAYDADATVVLIKFEGDIESGNGSLSVSDNGHGMDMDVILNSWMIIAATTKKANTLSKNGNRRVLGEKGIGRFASSRLARKLDLITRMSGQETEIFAVFDWSQFDDDDLFLDKVKFSAFNRSPEVIVKSSSLNNLTESTESTWQNGTVLKMNGLKHHWEKSDLEQLQRGLSRLVSPFSKDTEFNIYVETPTNVNQIATKIEPPEIIRYPHYTVNGNINSNGEYKFRISVETTGETHEVSGYFYSRYADGDWDVISSQESRVDQNEFRGIKCGPFSFELRIWDRDELENVKQKIGSGIRDIRKDLDSIAGINIYRDEFRVLPYGEPDNDWLRLDIRRVQNPTKHLSNNQMTGYISITADENPGLHDRSNREGLDNNIAYSDLRGTMMRILSDLEGIRYLSKRKTDQTEKKNREQKGLFSNPDLTELKVSLQNEVLDIKKTMQLVSQAETDWKIQIKNFQEVLSQYHSLATLGAIVDKVLHDGRQPLASVQVEAGLGKEYAEDLFKTIDENIISSKSIKKIYQSFHKIIDQASIIRQVFNRIEPFGGRKRGRPKRYYIEDLIKDVFSIYQREITETFITTDLPDSETLVTIDVTELSEIIMNLLINSIYWLGTVPKDKRAIKVEISRRKEGELEILFGDSGPGVDAKYHDLIFDPYFSTRTDGYGLGLSLVGEIVKDYYNGSVELLENSKNSGAIFRIVLRKRV